MINRGKCAVCGHNVCYMCANVCHYCEQKAQGRFDKTPASPLEGKSCQHCGKPVKEYDDHFVQNECTMLDMSHWSCDEKPPEGKECGNCRWDAECKNAPSEEPHETCGPEHKNFMPKLVAAPDASDGKSCKTCYAGPVRKTNDGPGSMVRICVLCYNLSCWKAKDDPSVMQKKEEPAPKGHKCIEVEACKGCGHGFDFHMNESGPCVAIGCVCKAYVVPSTEGAVRMHEWKWTINHTLDVDTGIERTIVLVKQSEAEAALAEARAQAMNSGGCPYHEVDNRNECPHIQRREVALAEAHKENLAMSGRIVGLENALAEEQAERMKVGQQMTHQFARIRELEVALAEALQHKREALDAELEARGKAVDLQAKLAGRDEIIRLAGEGFEAKLAELRKLRFPVTVEDFERRIAGERLGVYDWAFVSYISENKGTKYEFKTPVVQLDEANQVITLFKVRLAAAETDVRKLNEKLIAADKYWKARVASLEQQLAAAEKVTESADRIMDKSEARIATLEREIDSTKINLKLRETQVDALNEKLATAGRDMRLDWAKREDVWEGKLAAEKARAQSFFDRVSSLESKLFTEERQHSHDVVDLKEKLALATRRTVIADEIKDWPDYMEQGSCARCSETLKAYAAKRIAELEEKLVAETKRSAYWQMQFDGLSERTGTAEKRVAELEASNDVLVADVAAAAKRNEALEADVARRAPSVLHVDPALHLADYLAARRDAQRSLDQGKL